MARRRYQYQGMRRAAQYGSMRARSAYRSRGGARGIAGMSLPWIAGGALGYAAPRLHPMQDTLIMLAAVLPIRLPYNIQNIAKGYVFGMVARQYVPGLIPQIGSGNTEQSSNFV